MKRTKEQNVGVAHGAWGEQVAVERLRLEGLEIIERNVRPFVHDRRLEIDVVAYDPREDTMVFVEVKQHATHRAGEGVIRGVDARKRRNMRVVCNAWRRKNRWNGGYRFDVIEVYGVPGGGRPEVEHVRRVNLFTPPRHFALWV